MIRLKVCGMRDVPNIREVSQLGPEYMGFIFYRKSPRYVGADFTMPLLPAAVKKVGVFVNEPGEVIVDSIGKFGLHFVQLHGEESPEQCAQLKKYAGVIKVFSIGDDFDFAATRPYQPVSDFFLFDTKGKLYGGNARTFNWSLLEKYNQEVPFFLSGGIRPEHIADIQKLTDMNLHAIDVNSGVEIRPGLKDIGRITEIRNILNVNV